MRGSGILFASFATVSGCASMPAVEVPREDPRTSGSAHFELAPLEHSVPDARCGADVTLPSADAKGVPLLEDDAQGADVTCRYDARHFEAVLYGDVGGLELRGSFDGGHSLDATVRIDLPGAIYQSTGACTVVFDEDSGGVLAGRFWCNEIASHAAGSACAVKGADASGQPTSFFRFRGCTPL